MTCTPMYTHPLRKRENPQKYWFSEGFKWWSRGESNPRPNTNHADLYVRSPRLDLTEKLPGNGPLFCQLPVESRSSTRKPGVGPSLLSSLRPT